MAAETIYQTVKYKIDKHGNPIEAGRTVYEGVCRQTAVAEADKRYSAFAQFGVRDTAVEVRKITDDLGDFVFYDVVYTAGAHAE